jgi:hypothetical protein
MIRILLAALIALTLAFPAAAQVQQARGKATVSYKGKAAPPDVRARALQNAQLKAVEFYYAEAGESEAQNFDAIRGRILENPDRYLLDTTVLAEEDNVASQQYTVAVKVSLNVANLRNDTKASSAVGKAARTERSQLAFLFVSREIESVKSYDTRVTRRADTSVKVDASVSTAQKGSEGESVKRGRVATDAATTETGAAGRSVSATTETGGTQTRRANESAWRLFPSANLNQVFTQTFAKAGFRVNEAALVEPYTGGKFKVAQVEDDYRAGNDLKPATLQSVALGMKQAQIPYIAIGTLDLGMADRDPQTGLQRVPVTVNARVWDVSAAIPETIASVGPVQYAGVGATDEEARTAALKLAAQSASRELTAQLTNLGLK